MNFVTGLTNQAVQLKDFSLANSLSGFQCKPNGWPARCQDTDFRNDIHTISFLLFAPLPIYNLELNKP